MPTGRPSDYGDEIAGLICERIAQGEGVISISRDPAMPGQSTIYQWLDRYPDFAERYARARLVQADRLFEECLDIADDSSGDLRTITRKDGSEVEVMDSEFAARSRLRVDTRKWMAAKLSPKKYADKTVLVGGTPGVDEPLQVVTDLDRAKAVASLVAKVKKGT